MIVNNFSTKVFGVDLPNITQGDNIAKLREEILNVIGWAKISIYSVAYTNNDISYTNKREVPI